MSWETEQWARQQRAGDPVRKAILVAVANEADTSGRNAFPSVKFIAYQCEVSERTVQRRLQELEDMCLLKRVKRFRPDGSQSSNGYDLIGYEAPAQFTTKEKKRRGDRLTPPPDKLSGGGDAGDTGRVTMASPQRPDPLPIPPAADDKSPAAPPQGGLPLEPDAEEPEAEAPRRKRGCRLPDDWTPPPIDELPLTTQAVVKQWPAGAYEFVADGFKAHWKAEGGAKASKLDWDAAWVKWLCSESARIMAAARNGITFMLMEKRKLSAEYADVEQRQQGESEHAALIRRFLRQDLGDRTYFGWFKATALSIVDTGGGWVVTVFTPSRFVADWLKQHFSTQIVRFAQKALDTSNILVGYEVVSER